MLPVLAAVLAFLLPLVSAQVGSIGTCSSERVNSYISALPDGEQCSLAFQTVRFETTSNQSTVEAALEAFCTPNCAEPLARYSALACGDREFGVSLVLYCLPAPNSTVTQRCRTIFPDLVNSSIIQCGEPTQNLRVVVYCLEATPKDLNSGKNSIAVRYRQAGNCFNIRASTLGCM